MQLRILIIPDKRLGGAILVCLAFVGIALIMVSSAHQLFNPSLEYMIQRDVFGVLDHEQNENLIPNFFILSEK